MKSRIKRALTNDGEFNPLDESLSADEWAAKRNAQLSRQPQKPRGASAFLWIEREEGFEKELNKVWEEEIDAHTATEHRMLRKLREHSSSSNSPEAIRELRQLLKSDGRGYDIEKERRPKNKNIHRSREWHHVVSH